MSTTPIIDRAERSAAATRWRLDPAGSNAKFQVQHFWGLITVKGHFDRLDGWLEVDRGGRRRIELNIDATSVRTRNPMGDWHLRAADRANRRPAADRRKHPPGPAPARHELEPTRDDPDAP
ncbi:MAG: YceI family protein [Actinomycetota bacterium]|nr:YceI family protein [Actinomycetota bacterium]